MRYRVEVENPAGTKCVWVGWSLENALRARSAWSWGHPNQVVRIFKRSVRVEW